MYDGFKNYFSLPDNLYLTPQFPISDYVSDILNTEIFMSIQYAGHVLKSGDI